MSDPKTPTPESWFDAMLTRRELAVRAASVAAGVGVLGTLGCSTQTSDGDSREDDVSLTNFRALDLQRSERWDFGAQDDALNQKNVVQTDVAGSSQWEEFRSTAALTALFAPSSKHAALENHTLLEAMDLTRGDATVASALKPVHSEATEEAYQRGVALANTVASSGKLASTLVVLDLAGPEAVAAAAGMASVFQPVLHLDNWPHPKGVVESQNTLGSMLYFAKEFQDLAKVRAEDAPAVLVLDRDRLKEAGASPEVFDNRYAIELPEYARIKEAGVEQILYVVPNAETDQELDDLNEDFAVFAAAGTPVEMIALSEFKPASDEAKAEASTSLAAMPPGQTAPPLDADQEPVTQAPQYHTHQHYHYGGSPFGSFWFWMYLTSFRPPLFGGYATPTVRTTPRRQNYRPVQRPTQFGTRYSGTSLSGVGRQRPTGLGRVTAPVNTRTGRVEGGVYGAAAASYATRRSAARVGSPQRGTSSSGRGVYSTGG